MLSLSLTFYLFSTAFRSWGSVERGPTYFTYLLQIPVHHHSDIYSPILALEEGHRIQAYSWYPYLVQQVMSPGRVLSAKSTSKIMNPYIRSLARYDTSIGHSNASLLLKSIIVISTNISLESLIIVMIDKYIA